jgi:hypothetical protein
MKISARIDKQLGNHKVTVMTNNIARSIDIPPKAGEAGSAVTGSEASFTSTL